MTAPTITSRTDTDNGTTNNPDFDLPTTGINAGDLLLLVMANREGNITGGAIPPSFTDSTGDTWTQLFEYEFASNNGLQAYYKEADGDEDTATPETLTIQYSTSTGAPNSGDKSSGALYVIPDWDTASAPEASTNVNGNGTTANPSSIAHSNGSGDYLYIAACSLDTLDATGITYPSGYTNTAALPTTSGGACTLLVATKDGTGTSSEDPGAFGGFSTNYVTAVIAIPGVSASGSVAPLGGVAGDGGLAGPGGLAGSGGGLIG